MSEMRVYGALRFKINEGYTITELLGLLRGILGEPEDVEYASKYIDGEFIKTDEVEYFYYGGDYRFVCDDVGRLYLDYVLFDEEDEYSDENKVLPLDELLALQSDIVNKFGSIVIEECRVVFTEWYTGTDMPVIWGS